MLIYIYCEYCEYVTIFMYIMQICICTTIQQKPRFINWGAAKTLAFSSLRS